MNAKKRITASASCTDHAICIYLRAVEQLKAVRQASAKESRYTREVLLNVSEKLRELEISNPGLGETITKVTTINSETGKREQKRRTLRKAVEGFLESCQTVEDRANQIIEKLDQQERLRANTIDKIKTENSIGHDTSVSRARELLARVIESSFLDRELKRLATKTLVQLEELENVRNFAHRTNDDYGSLQQYFYSIYYYLIRTCSSERSIIIISSPDRWIPLSFIPNEKMKLTFCAVPHQRVAVARCGHDSFCSGELHVKRSCRPWNDARGDFTKTSIKYGVMKDLEYRLQQNETGNRPPKKKMIEA